MKEEPSIRPLWIFLCVSTYLIIVGIVVIVAFVEMIHKGKFPTYLIVISCFMGLCYLIIMLWTLSVFGRYYNRNSIRDELFSTSDKKKNEEKGNNAKMTATN